MHLAGPCDFSGIFIEILLWEIPLNSHFADAAKTQRYAVTSAPARSRATSHPAVDYEFRPRHVAGRVGSEEQHSIGDILRLSGPAERHPGSGHLVRSIGALLPVETSIFVQRGVG
jgi:hypothetical protein